MNRLGYFFCIGSLLLSVALIGLLMPSASVSVAVAETARSCKTLEEDIEISLVGDLEGVSMYDLLSHYLEVPTAKVSSGQAVVRQFGGC